MSNSLQPCIDFCPKLKKVSDIKTLSPRLYFYPVADDLPAESPRYWEIADADGNHTVGFSNSRQKVQYFIESIPNCPGAEERKLLGLIPIKSCMNEVVDNLI